MTAPYAWIITKDDINTGAVDTSGPRNAPAELVAQLAKGEGAAFRLYDDDGELYYTGWIIGDFTGFEPLDDFGAPGAGCTEIRYLGRSTEWETL